MPLSAVKLEAPVQRPGKIFAIGLNYADHIAESKMATRQGDLVIRTVRALVVSVKFLPSSLNVKADWAGRAAITAYDGADENSF